MSTRALQVMLAVGLMLVIGAVIGGVARAPSSPSSSTPLGPADAQRSASPSVAGSDPEDATADELSTGPVTSGPTPADGTSSSGGIDASELSATTTTPATVTTSPGGTVEGDAVDCTAVVALADAVALSDGIDFSLAWPELQAALVEAGDSAAASYRAVIPVAPDEIDADLRRLADYNTALGATAAAATSVTEFQATVAGADQTLLESTRAVDQFMRASCSIGLTAD